MLDVVILHMVLFKSSFSASCWLKEPGFATEMLDRKVALIVDKKMQTRQSLIKVIAMYIFKLQPYMSFHYFEPCNDTVYVKLTTMLQWA